MTSHLYIHKPSYDKQKSVKKTFKTLICFLTFIKTDEENSNDKKDFHPPLLSSTKYTCKSLKFSGIHFNFRKYASLK